MSSHRIKSNPVAQTIDIDSSDGLLGCLWRWVLLKKVFVVVAVRRHCFCVALVAVRGPSGLFVMYDMNMYRKNTYVRPEAHDTSIIRVALQQLLIAVALLI